MSPLALIRSVLADNRLDPAERRNFLRRCAREGRWREWCREITRPTRLVLGTLVRRVRAPSPTRATHTGTASGPPHDRPPVLGSFIAPVAPVDYPTDDRTDRLRDVERELAGDLRLAGAARATLTSTDLSALDDYESHHAYHRLYWAARLAAAATLGHEQAAHALVTSLERWLAADWAADPRHRAAYTTSERIISCVEVLYWGRVGRVSELSAIEDRLAARIGVDAAHLLRNTEIGLGAHNHVLTNARALNLAALVLPSHTEAPAWRAEAFRIWETYFPPLLLEDGSFNEASSFYTVMHARCILEYLITAGRIGRRPDASTEQRLLDCLTLGSQLVRADGSIPRFGDISPDHVAADLHGIFAAAWELGFLSQPARQTARTLAAHYFLGRAPAGDAPPRGDYRPIFPSGGWCFLRNDTLDAELVAHGETGVRTTPHGDAGRGSFELWWSGHVLIRDPGNPTYAGPARHWYRSAAGQNTTALDGLTTGISDEYQYRLPRWYTDVQAGRWTVDDAPGGATFACDGLARLAPDLRLERSWRWTSSTSLLLQERIQGTGRFDFVSSLHLGDAPWRRTGPDAFEFHLPARAGRCTMRFLVPDGLAIEEAPARFAPEYGVECEGRVIRLVGTVSVPISWAVHWEFAPPP